MKEEIKSLLTKIEELGWSIQEEGHNEYRISKYSPCGQDFGISIEGDSDQDLINNIYQRYEDFDVSEETYIWLDSTGHGRKGAPYHMRDVLEDMEHCEKMILDLYEELIK
jgi:hypothetical protein